MKLTVGEQCSRLVNFFKSRRVGRLAMAAIISVFLFSCAGPKNVTYFKDIPDTGRLKSVAEASYSTPRIQVDDILQITIQTLDAGATSVLNQQNTAAWPTIGSSTASAAPGGNISGYLVDKDGNVVLPLIGKLLVKDKTTEEVRTEVTAKAAQYYKDPVVNVRYANFKITVLGEVARPSSYVMPNEKVTLLDAIGMAGDLTIFGKRENVLLIRERDGKKEFARFNLNDSHLFTSPYYYLQQGDVVYVEPNKSKVVATDASRLRNITIISSAITLLVVILTRVKF
ncbi:MAG TPA: polysaccharide biosynthesis/export family protein [Chitinophaga sp.]|uniref:polysaccharide biosynthesis/export family protein n=1 Tax=Chitinophaga sp. TaxID=1869181 RepID=UPI002CCA3675|nr:polysaccharide biosynthesis/export family protein [Chitinophaga sp.]HVI48410.1 polysaccharide biosynthesis/export family protein [Chitinophaga sp.]